MSERNSKIYSKIANFNGPLSVSKQWLSNEVNKIHKILRSQGKNTQKVLANYIPKFMETNNFENLLERCLALSNLPRGACIERYVIYYGEELGKRKWDEYCFRMAEVNSQEYKGMTDAEFKTYNESRSQTKNNMIKRYGEELGKRKWDEYREKQSYTKSIDYYIDQFGEIEGERKFKHLSFLKGHSLKSYQYRLGDRIGLSKYKHRIKTLPDFYSEVASEMFIEIDNRLSIDSNIYYAPKTKEFGKMNMELGKYTFFDFVIPDIKLCIEFHGDVFHANPSTYSSEDRPNPFNSNLTSEDIWEHDKIKQKVLLDEKYIIIVVWESEYNRSKENTINKLVEQINEQVRNYR